MRRLGNVQNFKHTCFAFELLSSWYVYMANCCPGRVIKAGDKGGAQRKLCGIFLTPIMQKLRNISLLIYQPNIVKSTSNDLLAKQELSVTAKNLPITTLKTSCVYFLLTIHKPNNQGWPNVFCLQLPTELISSYSDKIMAPIVNTLPFYIKDRQLHLKLFVILIPLSKTSLFSQWILHLFILSFSMTMVPGLSINARLRNLALKHHAVQPNKYLHSIAFHSQLLQNNWWCSLGY